MISKIPHSMVYLSGSIINAIVSFFALAVFTEFLTTDDFGYFTIFKIYSQIVTIVIIFNGFQLLLQKHYTQADDGDGFHYTLFILCSIIAFVIVLLSWIFDGVLGFLVQIPAKWIIPFTLYGWFNFCQLYWLHIQQAQQKALRYVAIQMFSSIGSIGIGLFFVIQLGYNWEGRFYGAVISAILVIIIFLIFMLGRRKIPEPKFDISHAKKILVFGLPLFPQTLGAWIVSSIDRIYINHMEGISKTGIYGLAFSVASVLIMIIAAFNRSFMPKLFAVLNENDEKSKKRAVMMILKMDLIYFFLAFVGVIVAPFFFSLFIHERFISSVSALNWLLPAFALFGITQNRLNIIIFSKQTKAASWSTDSLAAIINLALCPVMIYYWGIVGAAQSTFISYLCAALMSWVAAQRVYQLPWFCFFR